MVAIDLDTQGDRLIAFCSHFKLFTGHDGTKKFSLLRLTPLALSATWYSPTQLWNEAEITADDSMEHSQARSLLLQLRRQLVELEGDLEKGYRPESPQRLLFAKAFSAGRQSAGSDWALSKWCHSLMAAALYDRVIWAFFVDDKAALASPFITAPDRPEGAQNLRDEYKRWPIIINSFTNVWMSECRPVISDRVRDNSSAANITSSLFEGYRRASARGRINIVEANFCAAALAIRALSTVSYVRFTK